MARNFRQPSNSSSLDTIANTFGNVIVLPPKHLPAQYPTTKRCNVLKPHPGQRELWLSPARFPICHSGRRSGKTEIAKRRLVMRAMDPWNQNLPFPAVSDDPRYFAGAPTWQQAKNIYWRDLKALIPDWAYWPNKARGISESELTIRLVSGAEICVVGLDRPERIEGSPWDGGILDEYGNMKPDTWGEHVRPVMSDRRGWCMFIGVPEGRNHYYDLVEFARMEEFESQETGKPPTMAVYHWPSSDILDPEEIRLAQKELDELTFRQEYGGDFLYFQGRAYYPFDRNIHCKRLKYNIDNPLIFCFDFNIAPGIAVVAQEQPLPGQYLEYQSDAGVWIREPIIGTGVIGEVYIPRNSNTKMVCRKLWDDWKNHRGRIICYGDATGGSGGSAKTEGSDWDLVRQEFRGKWGGRVQFRLKDSNPRERARVNAVNSRLLSTSGTIRMMVDPLSAPKMVRDFEGVRLVEGGSGEIEKKKDPMLTHLSDALGYYCDYEFPTTPKEDRIVQIRM